MAALISLLGAFYIVGTPLWLVYHMVEYDTSKPAWYDNSPERADRNKHAARMTLATPIWPYFAAKALGKLIGRLVIDATKQDTP